MRKYIPHLTALLAFLVGTATMLAIVSGGKSFDSPHFRTSTSPQAVVQLERDYAYRTGDPITFTVFVDQPSGTEVDGSSFAVTDTDEGDMEFSSQLLGSKTGGDDSMVLAVRVTLRKWSYEQTFTVKATMSYIVSSSGDTEALQVPDITLHMSPTWDGRKTLNQGDNRLRQDEKANLNIILIAVGLFTSTCMVLFMRAARRKNSRIRASRPRVPTALESARDGFELRRDLILGRDYRLEHYEELERIVRGLFEIETVTTDRVAAELPTPHRWAQDHVLTVLTHCDKRLYQDLNLTKLEHAGLFSAFEQLLTEMPLHEMAPPPRTTRWTPITTRLKRLPHRKLTFLTVGAKWLWRHRPFRYYV